MTVRVDTRAMLVRDGDTAFAFVADCGAGTAMLDPHGAPQPLRTMRWGEKCRLARHADAEPAFLEAQFVAICCDGTPDPARRPALTALALWLHGSAAPALPLDAQALGAVTLQLCAESGIGPAALAAMAAPEVEALWQALAAAETTPATTGTDLIPDGMTRIVIEPDPPGQAAAPEETDAAAAPEEAVVAAAAAMQADAPHTGGSARPRIAATAPAAGEPLAPAAVAPAAGARPALVPTAPRSSAAAASAALGRAAADTAAERGRPAATAPTAKFRVADAAVESVRPAAAAAASEAMAAHSANRAAAEASGAETRAADAAVEPPGSARHSEQPASSHVPRASQTARARGLRQLTRATGAPRFRVAAKAVAPLSPADAHEAPATEMTDVQYAVLREPVVADGHEMLAAEAGQSSSAPTPRMGFAMPVAPTAAPVRRGAGGGAVPGQVRTPLAPIDGANAVLDTRLGALIDIVARSASPQPDVAPDPDALLGPLADRLADAVAELGLTGVE